MRIDSSGNVGINTSSPSTRLQVLSSGTDNTSGDSIASAAATFTGPNYAIPTAANPVNLQVMSNSTLGADVGATLGLGGRYSTTQFAQFAIIKGAKENATSGQYGTYLAFGTRANGYDIAERMRIDSSGNLLVGNTTQISGERFSVGSGSNVLAAWIQQNTNTSGYNGIVIGLGSNGNNTSSSFIRGNTNTVGNWYLYGNGTTSFTSDQRLKKNIESTRNGYLEDLAQLRVVKYNWLKDDDGTPKELGLIAQEVEQVFPGLVQDDTSKVSEDDETVYKTLKQSVLPFMLLKAIQELKAIVDEQALKISALESK
jgi:hypothetical protein